MYSLHPEYSLIARNRSVVSYLNDVAELRKTQVNPLYLQRAGEATAVAGAPVSSHCTGAQCAAHFFKLCASVGRWYLRSSASTKTETFCPIATSWGACVQHGVLPHFVALFVSIRGFAPSTFESIQFIDIMCAGGVYLCVLNNCHASPRPYTARGTCTRCHGGTGGQ